MSGPPPPAWDPVFALGWDLNFGGVDILMEDLQGAYLGTPRFLYLVPKDECRRNIIQMIPRWICLEFGV
jgi:hypothetical protein